jgi:2-polyprenyl-3-methyl-5-hydroxy-6-metoxy-1,4-benzoquinol methylase
MDPEKLAKTKEKYRLPNHWLRDPLHKYGLPYFGYMKLALEALPAPPANVLDAGCGDGRIAAEFVKHGYTVTGVDLLETAVYYAQQLVPEGRFFQADLRQPIDPAKLQPAAFDAAVMMEVYEHIPPEDCPAVLHNIHTLLKENGRFIISVPTHLQPPSQLHYRHFNPADLQAELTAAGFTIHTMFGQNRLSTFTKLFMSDQMERLLDNQWLQPVFLKRLRKVWYVRFANRAPLDQSQRIIAIAQKS